MTIRELLQAKPVLDKLTARKDLRFYTLFSLRRAIRDYNNTLEPFQEALNETRKKYLVDGEDGKKVIDPSRTAEFDAEILEMLDGSKAVSIRHKVKIPGDLSGLSWEDVLALGDLCEVDDGGEKDST